MPHSRPEILVVLPTYNELATIGSTVASVRQHIPDAHILIIDDASPDGTGAAADRIAETLPHVRVHHRAAKLGLGTAYTHGFRIALSEGYRRIVTMDSDGSHLSSDLPRLLAEANAGAGLVIGARWVPGGRIVNWPLYRRWISRAGTGFARVVLRSRLRDLTSGFRVYDAEWLSVVSLDQLDSEGYAFQVETAWTLERLACPISEIPITFVERTDGHSKMTLGIVAEAFANVLRWGWRLRRDQL
ncbi:polyprenol monophosphomannose synthase [Leucobacter sp. USHLN153]|uniref:polyprenol monophosphomannose synthase n=1 Tax=Leucobacter sp. USHLN153 TaxID=3081268 RepID=UPI003017047B